MLQELKHTPQPQRTRSKNAEVISVKQPLDTACPQEGRATSHGAVLVIHEPLVHVLGVNVVRNNLNKQPEKVRAQRAALLHTTLRHKRGAKFAIHLDPQQHPPVRSLQRFQHLSLHTPLLQPPPQEFQRHTVEGFLKVHLAHVQDLIGRAM
jgi:hypothetical protein